MWRWFVVLALGGLAALAGGGRRLAGGAVAAAGAGAVETYGRLPLTFEANTGQVDGRVRFLGRGLGMTLFVTPAEAVLRLRGPAGKVAVVRMRLVGANRDPRVLGVEPLPTRSNYLLGDEPRQWHTGVPHYARVRAEQVYPGVDLLYRGSRRQLEYDLAVAPGADPGRIRLAFGGAESIAIGGDGALVLHTAAGELVQPRPVVYQAAGGRRVEVAGRYVLLRPAADAAGSPPEVGFALGPYDRTQPLVIDPVLVYSTFLGGSGFDGCSAIAVDGAGNAYVTGGTDSTTFPGVDGSSIQPVETGTGSAFVTKIDAGGTSIVYSTFLGGGGGDLGAAIAVDGAGNAYVTGATSSTTFPGVSGGSIQPAAGGGEDAFVTKINASGTAIVYSTFLGGSGNDSGAGIAVDGAGNAYVTGGTDSANFPGVGGSSLQPGLAGGADAFVTKINAAGTAIVYSTFLGGADFDVGHGIAVDGSGNAYVTGVTASTAFPGVDAGSIQPAYGGGFFDAFVTKIDASGTAVLYSSFLGGSDSDGGLGVAVDGAGNAYVTGFTVSPAFPGVGAGSLQPARNGVQDAFVTKIDASGSAIAYSTFLGGPGGDTGFAIAVDRAGHAHVTGLTSSTTFPGVTGSSIQPLNGGGLDAFVAELDGAGSAIVAASFLGGSGTDYGRGIAVDGAGNTYVAGSTSSAAFPGVGMSSIQPAIGGSADGFVVKIGSPAEVPAVSPWGLAAMAALLGGALSMRVRRLRQG